MTSKEWEKKINETLKQKAEDVIKIFQTERRKDFGELVNLSEQSDALEKKKKELIAEQEKESKNFIPSNNVLNECGRKLHHIGRNIDGLEKQIDGLFKKLTSFPESIKEIYFFMKLIEK